MDDEQTGYMGVTRWVSFSHHGEPESGEARTRKVTTTGG